MLKREKLLFDNFIVNNVFHQGDDTDGKKDCRNNCVSKLCQHWFKQLPYFFAPDRVPHQYRSVGLVGQKSMETGIIRDKAVLLSEGMTLIQKYRKRIIVQFQ